MAHDSRFECQRFGVPAPGVKPRPPNTSKDPVGDRSRRSLVGNTASCVVASVHGPQKLDSCSEISSPYRWSPSNSVPPSTASMGVWGVKDRVHHTECLPCMPKTLTGYLLKVSAL